MSGFEAGKALRIVNHPTRRAIIEALGENGPLEWKRLAELSGERTGSLYHHLDVMETVVLKDRGRYSLTPLGGDIFKYIQGHPYPSARELGEIVRRNEKRSLLSVFAPRSFISSLASSRRWLSATVLLTLLPSALLLGYYREGIWIFSVWSADNYLVPETSLAISLVLMVGIPLLSTNLLKLPSSLSPLVLSASISTLPFAVLGAFVRIFVLPTWFSTVILVLLQLRTAGVMGAGISVSSGLRIEKSLIISLILVYISAVFILLLQS